MQGRGGSKKWVSFNFVGVGHDIDGKDGRQLLDALGGPAAPVLEALACRVILTAKEGAAHAARDAVTPGGVGEADQGGAGAGHGGVVCKGCEPRVAQGREGIKKVGVL